MRNANRFVTLFSFAMVALVLAPGGVLSAAGGQETARRSVHRRAYGGHYLSGSEEKV